MKANIGAKMYSGEIKKVSVTLNQNQQVKETVPFLEQLDLEVVRNRSKGRKLKRTILATQTACLSLLVLAQPTFAMEVSNVKSEASTLMLELMVIVALLGVGASVIGLMLAGVWKMFFGASNADQWTHNIIKGLGQVVAAPAIIALVIGVASLLFQNVPIFQPIGGAIGTFIGK